MHGDVEYHRGVVFTMISGRLAGEGPIAGIVSYFGGLYPMVLGFGAKVLGTSFDGLLSVASWPFTLLLPLALLALGRALWPQRTLEPALLVFIGTIGSSLGRSESTEWVFSVLPSGANEWPVYPPRRGAGPADLRPRRRAPTCIGPALARRRPAVRARRLDPGPGRDLHHRGRRQAIAALRARPERGMRSAITAALVVGGTAIVASAWWWIPRAVAARRVPSVPARELSGVERTRLEPRWCPEHAGRDRAPRARRPRGPDPFAGPHRGVVRLVARRLHPARGRGAAAR